MNHRTSNGMTMLEVMFAVTILSIVMGILFTLSLGIGSAAGVQESQVKMSESGRSAMMRLVNEVRQAQRLSISTTNTFPGATLSYRVAQDADGNGTAVNRNGAIELSALRTIQRDTNDLNNDGQRDNQLIVAQGTTVLTVLANNVSTLTETNTDTNGNGRLERGFWVNNSGGTLTISILTQERLANGRMMSNLYSSVVRPRN